MPEEELRLDVFASYDDDDLERLEDDLENVDDAIAASGKGNREVNIDVDTDAIIAAGELEALDEIIEAIDDEVEVDVETESDLNQLTESVDDNVEIDVETKEKLNEVIESVDDQVEVDIETESDLNEVIEAIDDEVEVDVETESDLNQLIESIDDEVELDIETESDLNEVIESIDNDIEIGVETNTDDATELFNEIESDIDDTIDNIDDLLDALENADSDTSGDSADALRPTRSENAGIVAEGQDPFEAPTLARDRLDAVNELQERNNVLRDQLLKRSEKDPLKSELTKEGVAQNIAAEGMGADAQRNLNDALERIEETDEDLTQETNNILRERLLKRSEKDPLKSDLTEEGVAQNIAAEGMSADAQRSLNDALETVEETDEDEESRRREIQDSFEMNTFGDIVDTLTDRANDDSDTIRNVFRSSENVDDDEFESDLDQQFDKIQSTDRSSGRNFAKAKRSFFNQLDEIGGGLKSFQFTIAAFNQTLVSIFPALLSFAGAIPAAIVALGGLAAAAITAMGALGAVGILGLGGMALQGNGELDIQPIMNRLQDIFDAFITAFTPLMKTFVAPVENAFNTIEALADPLAQAASGLTAFQSLFNDTLATVAQGLPSFTAKLVAFGQAAIPILRGFIQFVNNTNFIGFFAEQLQRASVSIFLIIESVKQLLPFIINLSQGFLLVASVILGTIATIAAIANHFPLLTAAIGAVIGALLLLVTVTTLYTLITTSSAISAAIGFAASLLKTAAAAVVAQTSLIGLVALLLPLTILVAAIGSNLIDLSSIFDDLTGSIMGTNDSLRQFHKLTGRSSFSSGFSGPGSPIGRTGGQGSNYDVSVISDGDKDRAARSAYASSYELKQREQTNSIFGS